jgi:hypothetical protein
MGLLDKSLLQDLGIELSDQDFASLEEHFDTTLRDRVITEITEEITTEQAQQLASMQGASDEQLQAWLATNVPNLGEIVSDEVDILLGELAQSSDAFGGGSQGQPT